MAKDDIPADAVATRRKETPQLIQQTLLRDLGWVMFEPNGDPLWSANHRTV